VVPVFGGGERRSLGLSGVNRYESGPENVSLYKRVGSSCYYYKMHVCAQRLEREMVVEITTARCDTVLPSQSLLETYKRSERSQRFLQDERNCE